MKNKIIIGIVGEMAAGKGTVVTYLKINIKHLHTVILLH